MPQSLGRYGVGLANYPDTSELAFEWYLKNHLGSTIAVYKTTGTTAGPPELKYAYDYRSYGEKINLTEGTDKVTENFTGKELDDETGLGYWKARYLDLMLGMWVSVDPKRQFASSYLYAGNGANYESVHMTGPLPAGTYTISPMIKNHPQGKYKNYMKLTLDEDNQMYARIQPVNATEC